jgi:hypothetical protein
MMLTRSVRTAGKPTTWTSRKPAHHTTQHSYSSLRILRVQQLLIVSNRRLSYCKLPTSLFAMNQGAILSSILGFVKRQTL